MYCITSYLYFLLIRSRLVFGTQFGLQIGVLLIGFAIASTNNIKVNNLQIVTVCCCHDVSTNGKVKFFFKNNFYIIKSILAVLLSSVMPLSQFGNFDCNSTAN